MTNPYLSTPRPSASQTIYGESNPSQFNTFTAPNVFGGQGWGPLTEKAYQQYGGTASGFATTRDQLLSLQQQAAAQKAPTINYGAASGALGQQAAYGAQQMGDVGAMQAQAAQLARMGRGGGPSAARAAFGQSAGANAAGAQGAAAAGGSPMAMRAALSGLGAANTSAAAQYGGARAGEMQSAEQAAIAARGNIASTLSGVRGQTIGAAGQAAQMAEAPASLQEQQNALDAQTSNAYVQSLLGLQSQQQQSQIGQNQNMIDEYLAEQGYNQQQNATNTSEITGGASAGLAFMAALA